MKENKMMEYISRVYPSASFDIKNNPWYVDMKTGIYGNISPDFKSINKVGFVGLDAWGYAKYSEVIYHNNRLFFVSRWNDEGPKVLVKNVDGATEIEIELKRLPIRKQCKAEPFFSFCFLEGDYIYCLGSSYPAIVRIDTRDLNVEYAEEWVREVDLKINPSVILGYCAAYGVEEDEARMFIPCSAAAGIIVLNKDPLKTEFRPLDIASGGASYLCKCSEDIFLIGGCGTNGNRLYMWDIENNQMIQEYRLDDNPNLLPITKIIKSNQGFYVFPFQNRGCLESDIYYLDGKEGSLKKTGLLKKEIVKNNYIDMEVVYASIVDGDVLIYVTGCDLCWHQYNINNGEKCDFLVAIDAKKAESREVVYSYLREITVNKTPMKEAVVGLEQFTSFIAHMDR